MADQAERLRQLVLQSQPPSGESGDGQLLLVFGAEAAVGASVLSSQLAIAWRRRGDAVSLVDLSRDREPLQAFGHVASRATLNDVISQQRMLREAWVSGPCGLRLIGGDLRDTSLEPEHPLLQQLVSATAQSHVLVDVQDLRDLLALLPLASQCLFVTTGESEVATATYRAIKSSVQRLRGAGCWLTMNQVIDLTAAIELQDRIVAACDRCLNLAMGTLGCLPWDPMLTRGRPTAVALTSALRSSPYQQAIDQMVSRIETHSACHVRRPRACAAI